MDVYSERAHLVALLAKIFPSWVGTDPSEPDWPVVYIQLPTGQCSWHISPDDWQDLFAHLELSPDGPAWDNHSTSEKYRRIRQAADEAVKVVW